LPIDKPKRLGYNIFNMNDSVTKSKIIAFKDLGIKSPISQGLSPKYYEMAEARRKRWAEEDAEKAKKNG
jgi:hypothetical protein